MSKLKTFTYNERRIIGALRSEGMQNRARLSSLLGVTPPTITRLVSCLIDKRLLCEQEDPSQEKRIGYPSKLLQLEPSGLYTAGAFFDPDHIYTCVCDLAGTPLASEIIEISDRSFDGIMTMTGESVRKHIAASGIDDSRIAGVGVSYPGHFTTDPNRVFRIKQFADWPSVNIETDLAPYFDYPVSHMSYAKAASLAEFYYGASRTDRSSCLIWLSYGIGGAAIIDQRLYLGQNKDAAEFGGIFPKSAPRPSGQNLMDTLREADEKLTRLDDIDDSWLERPAMQNWMIRSCEQLRWLCLIIARTFDPEAIVIGGILPPAVIDYFVREIGDGESLGEDFMVTPPLIKRATKDTEPHLGAAALPVYDLFSPATFSGQATKGW
ncbi:MAG: ROK family transcriptional regulator [Cohaesibacteraceae bacterium]|nr:ROK family transcriptional regulator [Cohaesibacteraceae bacterium]MBL4875478.1 ROK family transcriptional regulator [Cohaesibacteraceae bacterium]